jgi:hypothetical protein
MKICAIAVVIAACGSKSHGVSDGAAMIDGISDGTADVGSTGPIVHAFDLASRMPPHLAIMFTMSWFGIPAGDPQGGGPDSGYGNTVWGGHCVAVNAPATCTTCILGGTNGTCRDNAGPLQRDTASRRRMLAGIYSASALDIEGQRRVDLMLSQVRRPCDDGAKLDAWTMQMNGTRDTPAHPENPPCETCTIAYNAALGFLKQADAAGMTNVVIPGVDATWYFHFGNSKGLGTCDDTTGNPKQHCIDALTQDFIDMSNMSAAHPSGLKLGGKPVLYAYFDPIYLTPTQWQALFQDARNRSGRDFYVIATTQNATRTADFAAFDGLAPWVKPDAWPNTTGATVRAHAYNWAASLHEPLFTALPTYPGRVVFGGMTPGFDDYTMSWGGCMERQLPPGNPRDPNLLAGEFDYFKAKGVRGLVGETWDDWTEGSHFEPDVQGGTSVLVAMRQQLGALFGEPADPIGDQRLDTQWRSYGQARNCSGNPVVLPPVTKLSCP